MNNSAEKVLPPENAQALEPVVAALIEQVETMIRESGDSRGFDASKVVNEWIRLPVPALGGRTPLSYLGTVEGQKRVSQLLAIMQSGAYA